MSMGYFSIKRNRIGQVLFASVLLFSIVAAGYFWIVLGNAPHQEVTIIAPPFQTLPHEFPVAAKVDADVSVSASKGAPNRFTFASASVSKPDTKSPEEPGTKTASTRAPAVALAAPEGIQLASAPKQSDNSEKKSAERKPSAAKIKEQKPKTPRSTVEAIPVATTDEVPPKPVPEEKPPNTSCGIKMRTLGIVAERCLDVEPIIKELRRGTYSYNKLTRAYVGVPFRVVLILKPDGAQESGDAFAHIEGKQTSLASVFSQSVDATLRGADLVVDPAGPQRRTVTTMSSVEWEWIVTPSKAGNKFMTMDVMANIYLDPPNALPYQVGALHQEVEIVVTTFQRIKEAVSETGGAVMGLGAIVLSITGLVASLKPIRRRFVRYFRARRRRLLAVNSDPTSQG